MKKVSLFWIALGGIVALGIYFAITYKFPEIEVLQFYQRIDEEIISLEKKSPQTIEEILSGINETTSQIIEIGRTYDGEKDMDELFSTFNAQYAELKAYRDDVICAMNERLAKVKFNHINSVSSKLSKPLSTLGKQLSEHQQSRIESLMLLNEEIEGLFTELESLQHMFYHSKISETVRYFQQLNRLFSQVASVHEEYVQNMEAYYSVKAEYYEAIANKGVFDYIFKKYKPLSTLGKQLSEHQQSRIESLMLLNEEIEGLFTELESLQQMFYHSKISETVRYFQQLNRLFSQVASVHEEYVQNMEAYYSVKAEYYEAIANNGVFDYIFKK